MIVTTTLTYYRHPRYKTLVINLRSNEELGILDSDYIEDFYGVDGQITMHHLLTGHDYVMKMFPVPEETPSTLNDVFEGEYNPVKDLLDGDYELRFRVRDVAGNHTICNSVQNPYGNEGITKINLLILPKPKGKPQ